MPSNTTYGKAFEYSIAINYYEYLRGLGLKVELWTDPALDVARVAYASFQESDRIRYDLASRNTIQTLTVLEPGLTNQRNSNDLLTIRVVPDSAGQRGERELRRVSDEVRKIELCCGSFCHF
jgi:hypothetical protein